MYEYSDNYICYVSVWLLACISLALCQDGIGAKNATKSSILPEMSKLRDFEVTTSQKPVSTIREEQIEDELSNGATTTEKFIEKRKFIVKPSKENDKFQEIFSVRFNETGPTTVKSTTTTTKRTKASFSSSFKKYDDSEDLADSDDVDLTTSFDGLAKKSTIENGERKNRQYFDGLKGVTTNRGRTRFQNEPGFPEGLEMAPPIRLRKPLPGLVKAKPVDLNTNDDVASTLVADDMMDTTTITGSSDVEQQRPKFKKPPLIATHHPNFGPSTEVSRRPVIRPNMSFKQKISTSTVKTRLPEPDATEPENLISNNKTLEVTYSAPSNTVGPNYMSPPKASAVQQPIPPTATAWALASLKAPTNTSRTLRKPLNATNLHEQISKIKPFITWSTRLQKNNEESSSINNTPNITQVTESNEVSTGTSKKSMPSESSTANRLTPEITSTESFRHMMVSSLLTDYTPHGQNSTGTIIGGDTDQNKYEVYGSQKPDVENATTVIETLRPSSSTTPSESQNSNLLLVTSYKTIFENKNSSEDDSNVYTSSETPMSIMTPKKEVTKGELTTTTDRSNVVQLNVETPITENVGERITLGVQTSTEIFSKTPGLLFDYSEDHSSSIISNTTDKIQSSSSEAEVSLSDTDLSNQNHSTTTEHYIDSIKTKLDSKINDSIENRDSSEIVDFSHMFSSERPVSSSSISGVETVSIVSEKITSGKVFDFFLNKLLDIPNL